ncbi:MAG: decaprenyl-phosphate phosphoribosyltransferase [Anaerolineaceae bacterium]|nr:decaprenyl-phosphate phosphoribosyltransferase [Anaerolineaceae bacterium]
MFKALIKTMRPQQWTKNVIVLAALVFDRKLLNFDALIETLIGFLIFCLISSAVYIINDLIDAEADRQHPKKKFRPIAAGDLSPRAAIIATILLLLFGLPLAFLVEPAFGIIILLYFLMQLTYSLKLKQQPIIDVMIIAAGFLLRVASGVVLVDVERFSPWLYVCTGLGALYIGFGKRRAELSSLKSVAQSHRVALRGYTLPLLDNLITVVSSSTLMAYSLYTFSAPDLPQNNMMMLTIPFVAYGIFRYHYLIEVEEAGGAPDELLLKDRPLQLAIFLWGLTVLVLYYFL